MGSMGEATLYTTWDPVTVAVCACIALAYTHLLWCWGSLYVQTRRGKLLPGPVPVPIPSIGNLLSILDPFRFHVIIRRMHRKYGKMFRFWYGNTPFTMISDPNALKVVLSTGLKDFDRSALERSLFDTFLGEGLILVKNGEEWKKSRSLFTPAFSQASIDGWADIFESVGCEASDAIQSHIVGASNVDMESVFLDLTFGTIVQICFGAGAVPIDERKKLRKSFDYVLECCQWRFLASAVVGEYWKWLPQGWLQYDRCLNFLSDTIADHWRKRITSSDGNNGNDILSVLSERMVDPNADGTWISEEVVRAQVLTFLFAGHDTTANLLTWALYFISQNPEVEDKLLKEFVNVCGVKDLKSLPKKIPVATLNKMELTMNVLKETLRLRPSAPMRGRITTEEIVINGHVIPRNTNVGFNMYAVNTDPDYWENPDEFKPERFSEKTKMHPFQHLPFGAGPRRCLGEKLAYLQAQYLLATLLSKFKFTVLNPDQVDHVMMLTMRTTNGLLTAVDRR